MSEIGWWFYYNNYTECFCHIKKCATLKFDTRMSPSEQYALNYIDNLMRESSYIGSVGSGFIFSTLAATIASYNMRAAVNQHWIFARILFGAVILFNINKIMDTGSHIGMLSSIPRAFEILDEGLSEDSSLKIETKLFLDQLLHNHNKLT